MKTKKNLLNKSIDELNQILQKEYIKLADKLISYLMEMYALIISEGDTALHSHRYSYNKYYEILNKIETELASFGVKETRIFDERLKELYKKNSEVIGEQFNLGSYINKGTLENLIRSDWVGDGQRFSDRIWKDKRRLAETLQSELFEGIAAGKSPDKMTKVLMERFSVSYSNAKRLAVTEMSHIYNQSTLDKYMQAGIKNVQIIEQDDEHACPECKALNKKIFPISSCPKLPRHPRCRGSYLAVIE